MKKGFTLIELLVVVLIIGVLTAIAIPGYMKALEKSRVADALNTMSAVAKSEHNWYLVHNDYTNDFSDLDTTFTDRNGETAEDASFESLNYTFTLQGNNIRAARNNGEYTLYKLYEEGNIFCLPQSHYICEQYAWGINRKVCDSINGAWSNIQADCYNSVQERCLANDGSWVGNTKVSKFCGYLNPSDPVDVKEFEMCKTYEAHGYTAPEDSCNYSTFTGEGATCSSYYDGCNYGGFYQGAKCVGGIGDACKYSTFDQGSICNGANVGSCSYDTFYNGSVCNANLEGTCNSSTFTATTKCTSKAGISCTNSVFYEGSECIGLNEGGKYPGCQNSIFKEGSKCFANSSNACSTTGNLGGKEHGAVFEAGSYCVGEAANSCKGFKNFQAICVANASGACANTYTGSGCCKGTYCPANSPKCDCEADENGVHPKSC